MSCNHRVPEVACRRDAGRHLLPGRLRFFSLFTLVRIQCADAKGSSEQNVILFIGIVSFIVFASALYVAVTCGYYHIILRHQRENAVTVEAATVTVPQSPVGGIDKLVREAANNGAPEAVGKAKNLECSKEPTKASKDFSASCSDDCSHPHGLGLADVELPEVLAPAGSEIAPVFQGASPARPLRPRPPAPGCQAAGFLKMSGSRDLDSVIAEVQGLQDVPRCCTVWDWCSTSSPQGLPPAGAAAGPPTAPRAPNSMPKGRLRL